MGDPASNESREGDLLCGKYRLVSVLGAGGMGEVYRARNEAIGRDVAIKLLRKEHAKNEAIVARFLREAQAANLVRHPNVVDMIDLGKDEHGTPFIVQELLHGEDLAARVAREGGKLPLDIVMRVLEPVIDAVATGHQNGVVHRDLKPENVFLAEMNRQLVPKLLDFGISQIRAKPGEKRMTAVGIAMGTPMYMPPEQILGHEIDARADVWALGVILYELISGSLPFDAEVQSALFVAICNNAPAALDVVAPGTPKPIVDVVKKCLNKQKEHRFASAAELGNALSIAYRDGASATADTIKPPPGGGAANDEPMPKIPSLAPPPPLMSARAPARAAAPAPVQAVAPAQEAQEASLAPPRPTRAPSRRPPSGEHPRGSALALAMIAPAAPRNIPPIAPRHVPAEDFGTIVAWGLVLAGFVPGFLATLFMYKGFHYETLVTGIESDGLRLAAAAALALLGVYIAAGGYKRGREIVPEKGTALFYGMLSGACFLLAIRLLAGG